MRVVFLQDVEGVARGGEVKEVRKGFARNFLLPKNMAVPATPSALQRVARLARQADTVRLRELASMKALAQELDGVQVNIEMRAGSGGQLYGSVTAAIVSRELSTLTARELDRRSVVLDEPIRRTGLYEVKVVLHPDVEARVKVIVYPSGTDPSAMLPPEPRQEEGTPGDAGDAESPNAGAAGAPGTPQAGEARQATAVAEKAPEAGG